jgi:hypothetical protein
VLTRYNNDLCTALYFAMDIMYVPRGKVVLFEDRKVKVVDKGGCGSEASQKVKKREGKRWSYGKYPR